MAILQQIEHFPANILLGIIFILFLESLQSGQGGDQWWGRNPLNIIYHAAGTLAVQSLRCFSHSSSIQTYKVCCCSSINGNAGWERLICLKVAQKGHGWTRIRTQASCPWHPNCGAIEVLCNILFWPDTDLNGSSGNSSIHFLKEHHLNYQGIPCSSQNTCLIKRVFKNLPYLGPLPHPILSPLK